MPQISLNSPYVSVFRFGVQFDVYNRKVIFSDLSTYSGSSGSGIFSISGISFSMIDQQGIELAKIDFTDSSKYIIPSVANTFELDLSSLNYAYLFQTYKISGAIKDTSGNVYYTTPVYKKICEPVNLTESGYVPGIFQVSANCPDNILTIKELTVFTYNNSLPSSTIKTGTLYYPTGTIGSVNFTGTPFSNNAIITGEYRINCTTTADYDLQDDVSVLITYLTNNVFPIVCSNKIADLLCCMVELQSTYRKNCDNAIGKNAQQQLNSVAIPLMLGLIKETNGQDASDEATLIRKTLKCDCGATSMRQNEFTPINPTVNNIVLTGVGGTTIPSATINGNTKTFNIASNVYQVVKGNLSDLGFAIELDNSTPYLVRYKITFDYNNIASYVLTAISNNPTLIAQLNALIQAGGNIDLSGLDGKCVIDLGAGTYVVTQPVLANTNLDSIKINGTTYNVNLLVSNTVAVQSFLNGLALGVFTVSVNGGILLILSVGNTNVVNSIALSNPSLVLPFQTTNYTIVQVLQAIVDYICALTALQVKLGNTLTLWQIDYNGNQISQSFTGVQSQAAFNQGVADSIYNLVNQIDLLTGITCAKIAAIFPESPNAIVSNSTRFYGKDGSDCIAYSNKQLAFGLIAAINAYADVKEAFCAIDCTTPGSCPDISNINIAIVGSAIGVYGLTWATTPSATQTVTLRYKLSSNPNYTTTTNALLILPNGNISGTSPYTIPGLVAGQTYDVQIINNCGGVGFVKQITVPSGSVFPGSYLVDPILYNVCGNSPITLYSASPFAPGVAMYTDAGLTTLATGYNFIADETGAIYSMNSATAIVGASTGNNCDTGILGKYKIDNSTVSICGQPASLLYTNGAFAVGGIIYSDSGLTTPVTGYSYLMLQNGAIYNLNSVTGQIGVSTGLACSTISGTFALDNSLVTVCAASTLTLYSATVFGTGVTMYTDTGLTTPVTGFIYIKDATGVVYDLNSSTGVVGGVAMAC